MTQNIDERLGAIVAQKKAHDEAEIAAQDASKRQAEEDMKAKAVMKKKIEHLFLRITEASIRINEKIKADGININVDNSRREDSSYLAQFQCMVFLDGRDSGMKLVLNVMDKGKVRPVQLIPHSGPSLNDIHIDNLDAENVMTLLVDFLELAISELRKKKR